MYSDMAANRHQPGLDKHLLGSVPLSEEEYFEYSVRRLQSLDKPDEEYA